MAASDDGTLWCVWLGSARERNATFRCQFGRSRGYLEQESIGVPIGRRKYLRVLSSFNLADQNSVHVLFRNSLKVTETCILFLPKIAEKVLVPRFVWDWGIGS